MLRRLLHSCLMVLVSVTVAALAFVLVIYDSVADRIADGRRAWRKGPRR